MHLLEVVQYLQTYYILKLMDITELLLEVVQ
nr:MAG TPA: hypothetical protein [Caudoviricetes sp.]